MSESSKANKANVGPNSYLKPKVTCTFALLKDASELQYGKGMGAESRRRFGEQASQRMVYPEAKARHDGLYWPSLCRSHGEKTYR